MELAMVARESGATLNAMAGKCGAETAMIVLEAWIELDTVLLEIAVESAVVPKILVDPEAVVSRIRVESMIVSEVGVESLIASGIRIGLSVAMTERGAGMATRLPRLLEARV